MRVFLRYPVYSDALDALNAGDQIQPLPPLHRTTNKISLHVLYTRFPHDSTCRHHSLSRIFRRGTDATPHISDVIGYHPSYETDRRQAIDVSRRLISTELPSLKVVDATIAHIRPRHTHCHHAFFCCCDSIHYPTTSVQEQLSTTSSTFDNIQRIRSKHGSLSAICMSTAFLGSIISKTNHSLANNCPQLNDKSLFKTQTYVNGEWIDAKSRKTFEVHGTPILLFVSYISNPSQTQQQATASAHNLRWTVATPKPPSPLQQPRCLPSANSQDASDHECCGNGIS